MRHSTLVLSVVILCVGLFLGCDKKKSGGGGGSAAGMTPSMGMDPMTDGMHGDMRPDPGMAAVPAVTTGPTGIKECDALLEMLSKCHKKHPSLKIAYNTVLKDAPGWKAKAQKRDPKQIGELAKACVRTAKEVGESFKCQ